MKGDFEIIIRREDTSLRQKGKVQWAKDVENNTSFLNNYARGRRNKNKIDFLKK